MPDWPATIADEETLEEVLSHPDPALMADLAAVPGDILVLGAAGKMGPTLCRLAKRADPESEGNDTNFIFLTFVLAYLPAGVVGLLFACIFAATMSSGVTARYT